MKEHLIRPVQRTRVYDQIIESLQELVIGGHIGVGDQLPPERELAEQFGVSRGSLREALRTLEYLGFLEIRPGGGTTVRKLDIATVLSPFSEFYASEDEFQVQAMEFRLIVEPPIARLCAERRSPEDLLKLEHWLDTMDADLSAKRVPDKSDPHFHVQIAESTGNYVLGQLVKAFAQVLFARKKIWLGGQAAVHHRDIYEAIKAQEPQKAEEAMRGHLMAIYNRMCTEYDWTPAFVVGSGA